MEKARLASLIDVPKEDVMNAADVADFLRCSVQSVYKMNSEMKLVARWKLFEGGKGLLWHRRDVQDFLASKMTRFGEMAAIRETTELIGKMPQPFDNGIQRWTPRKKSA